MKGMNEGLGIRKSVPNEGSKMCEGRKTDSSERWSCQGQGMTRICSERKGEGL